MRNFHAGFGRWGGAFGSRATEHRGGEDGFADGDPFYARRVSTSAGPHRAALIAETDALAALARENDLATPIPTCPGWTLADLVTHVGRAQRWAAAIIGARSRTEIALASVPDGARPAPDAAAPWLSDAARLVLDAVDRTGADTDVWTTLGVPRPAHWWIRRLAHETVVHRADALLALDRPVAIEPARAADAVSEWLELLALGLRRRTEPVLREGDTLHLHATDPGLGAAGEWSIRPSGVSVIWEHAHTKATVAVRGPASVLLLTLLGRTPPTGPDLRFYGDPAVFARWLERTPF